MSWTWEIVTGKMYADDGSLLGQGYSGTPQYRNNPLATSLQDRGPIPAGAYRINGPIDTLLHGPYALPLTPDPKNIMWSRSGFLIHGDSLVNPGSASEGCIILSPKSLREVIWNSNDRVLDVVATIDPETFTEGSAT